MTYVFDYDWVFEYWPVLLKGIGITVELTLVGGVLGISLGVFCAWVR
ncbi:MAG TPA: amino acid ABC transporter permease, partial [Ancylobacter sp.]